MLELIRSIPSERLKHYIRLRVKYLTLRKVFNIIRIEYQLALRKVHVKGYPYELTIGTSDICQLRCPLCATGIGTIKRQQGVMSEEVFDGIISQLGKYALSAYLHWWGEPFLNPKIIQFIKRAHEAKIGTVISSNLSFPLSEAVAEAIILSGLDMFMISLDGITDEVYHKYRIGGNFDLVIKNMHLLVRKRRECGYKTPYLEWQFLVTSQNEHQVKQLKHYAKKVGVDAVTLEQVIFLNGQKNRKDMEFWFPKNRKYRLKHPYSLSDRSDNLSPGYCWWLWRAVAINHDGGVSPCCYNNDIKEDFGNIMYDDFRAIWNNEKYISARFLFRKKRGTISTLCDKCKIANINGY